ncbi:carboxylesterase/lipase family protein [Sinomonas susongensis]|uniref:carboxylesterase/lipase family protein n=1 Tax=Sinomonas susongensis TaxID=1324851 RepID=UPI001485FFDF|nr:carboxylesterase family protein [Sinomonas susongensis]
MTSAPLVETSAGRVRGSDTGSVLRFLGIPYGDTTAGANRFLPPQPPVPWSGVRDALALGSIAPQPVRSGAAAGRFGGATVGEDCLVVNVWTPSTEGRRPVLFWIHGGGFFQGAGLTAHTDGEALARDLDVVVVSVNHRLGLLGFLYLHEVGGAEWGAEPNVGMLDLIAALRWVQENITAFGGAPEQVAIFGHSGGGGKVATLLTSPLARGLFSAACINGGPPFGLKDNGRATLNAMEALRRLGLERADRAVLRDLPLERLLEVQAKMGVGGLPTEHGMRFAPVVGTASVPTYPEEALASGVAADVPLIAGTALDEMRYILQMGPRWAEPGEHLSESRLAHLVGAGVDNPADVAPLLASYRAMEGWRERSNADLMLAILSDQFTIRTRRLLDARDRAGGAPVFAYLCDLNQGSRHGAFHGIEMPLFFRNVGKGSLPLDGKPYRVSSEVLSRALVAFARAGDPSSDPEGPNWPAYTSEQQRVLRFGDDGVEVVKGPYQQRVDVWRGVTTSSRTDPWGRAFATVGAK